MIFVENHAEVSWRQHTWKCLIQPKSCCADPDTIMKLKSSNRSPKKNGWCPRLDFPSYLAIWRTLSSRIASSSSISLRDCLQNNIASFTDIEVLLYETLKTQSCMRVNVIAGGRAAALHNPNVSRHHFCSQFICVGKNSKKWRRWFNFLSTSPKNI